MGDFAGRGGHDRRGSFGDADRDTVTTGLGAAVERVRIASHPALRRLLMEAGLDGPTADRDVAALHEGRILVLVQTTSVAAEAVAGALDDRG